LQYFAPTSEGNSGLRQVNYDVITHCLLLQPNFLIVMNSYQYMPRYVKILCHPQNRKYITYCIIIRRR